MRFALPGTEKDQVYNMTWCQALELGRGKACDMSCDRVYGLMGLVKEDLKVIPNYSKSLRKIFAEVHGREVGRD